MADELPVEYLQELEALQRRRQLAQALLGNSMKFQGAQSQGPVAAKTSPLAWLANTATGMMGLKMDSDAAAGVSGVKSRAQAASQKELEDLLAADPEKQYSQGLQGKFKGTRDIAKALQDRRTKRAETVSGVMKDTDPAAAVRVAQTENLPQNWAPPALPAPQFGTDPAGNPYATTVNRKGEPKLDYAPKGTNINLPGKENELVLGDMKTQLTERRAGADAAKGIYAATNRAIDALTRGAQAGGVEGFRQSVRKALQGFGVQAPATAQTEELQMALGNALLNEAQKIKPISNTDIETLRGILGSINTDPQALSRGLAFTQALALRGWGDYNNYVQAQNKSLTDPNARQLFSGAEIGYELPSQLFGPSQYQLEVLRQLQLAGGDISKFGEPGTGKPFAPNTQINVNPAGGFPVGNKPMLPAAQGSQKPIPFDQLSPEDKAALLKLLQGQ